MFDLDVVVQMVCESQAEGSLAGMRKPSNGNIKVVGGRDVCAFNGGQEQQRIPAENAGNEVKLQTMRQSSACLGEAEASREEIQTLTGVALKEQSQSCQILLSLNFCICVLEGNLCLVTNGRLMGTTDNSLSLLTLGRTLKQNLNR